MTAPPDDELVGRTLAGDREAFARLYDRYARLVRAVAADAGPDPGAAADLTQEAFLRAYRGLSRLRDPSRFGPWLVGIARQVVREHRRRRRFDALPADALAGEAAGPPADDADEAAHLLRLVARLPADERLAVRVFFLDGRDAAETARLLGRSRSGTYALIRKACSTLGRWLGADAARESHP